MLGVYIFILLSIPVGAYLSTQYQNTQSNASEKTVEKPALKIPPKNSASPAKKLLDSSSKMATIAGLLASPSPSPSSEPSETTIATSYGPTLSLKVALEGRPADNQKSRLFVGIVEGSLTSNPKFLLSFTIDVPAGGSYENLSLAGLTPGSSYTALLKGSAQIATSSAFTMSPNVTNLNGGGPLTLISGDLNDDNVINSSDYSIVQKALGATIKSAKWNENADFNKDEVINTFDLGLVKKNMGKAGASGAWTSPIPQVSTPSASLSAPAVGSPDESSGGYWIWVPK